MRLDSLSLRERLVIVAKEKALIPFHGYLNEEDTNIQPLIKLFPKWNVKAADRSWCAAFVYYCCIESGYDFPYSPKGCVSCSLAGCGGWEEFAMADEKIEYHRNDSSFIPMAGDIVIYDKVFIDKEHDHIGIILENKEDSLLVAEGNAFNTNTSSIVTRKKDEHIRAYIRIPDDYRYVG